MNRIEAIQLFLRVAETRSFSKAARILGISQPTASKQIAALERHLGLRLLRRTSRSFSLTQEGRDYYEAASRILGELENLESRIGAGQVAPRGTLRIAASTGLSRMCIVPRLPEFFARYPGLAVELAVSQRNINLVEEGIDVSVRIGALSDSGTHSLRIGSARVATMASDAFLRRHGLPRNPGELAHHPCIPYVHQGIPRPWQFRTPNGPFSLIPKGSFGCNDGESIRAGVLAGLGICHNSSWLFTEELASGEVKQILQEFAPPPDPIHALWPGSKEPTAKVRAFIRFLKKICAEHPHLAPA